MFIMESCIVDAAYTSGIEPEKVRASKLRFGMPILGVSASRDQYGRRRRYDSIWCRSGAVQCQAMLE